MSDGPKKITVGSCFSGIGGIELGLEWTGGFETRWQIENDRYASAVLAKHWPGVKQYGDITNIDPAELERVDLICGGYPCQPFSVAGKRAGTKDARHLWPHMFRIIRELRPRFALLENVPGHLSMGFGRVLGDLASIGFDAEWGLLSAAGVGAPHLRRRVFIVAHAAVNGRREIRAGESAASSAMANSGGLERPAGTKEQGIVRTLQAHGREHDHADGSGKARTEDVADPAGPRTRPISARSRDQGKGTADFDRSGKDVPDSKTSRFQITSKSKPQSGTAGSRSERGDISGRGKSDWWTTEPDVGRMAHGIPDRVDRLKCLGNSVVPQVAEKIGEIIMNWEGLW